MVHDVPTWIHGNKDSNIFMKSYALSKQFDALLAFKKPSLNRQDLLTYSTKNSFLKAIKFIEAPPSSYLA